jgi:colanic acid biosynthesis glycosyl transferase WcaI
MSNPAATDVVVLSNYYFPEPTGSAPPISDLSFWLAENGVATAVVTARPSYPQSVVFEGYKNGERDRETLRGVEVHRLATHVSAKRGMAGRLAGELSFMLAAIGARFGGKAPRGRHAICVCPSIFTVLIAPIFKQPGGRLLCIVHDIQSGLAQALGFGGGRLLMGLLRGLESWALNRCDVVVALSDGMAGELRGIGVRAPIIILPPQVDVSEITPTPEPAEGVPVLAYSGNLGRKQGLDQLITLASSLKQSGSDARIVIRGEGSERADLEAQAAAVGADNVTFLDLARREDFARVMGDAAMHLVPQRPDGATFAVPSKIFSIMAAERAFVATAQPDTPLWRFTAESGAGVCVEPYDAQALTEAVMALLADPARRANMARSGRRYVEQHIDRQVVCAAMWRAVNDGPGAVGHG